MTRHEYLATIPPAQRSREAPRSIIEVARQRGSAATTRAGAWKYLLAHLKPQHRSTRRAMSLGYSSPEDARKAWYLEQHHTRRNAYYTRLGEAAMATLGLREQDPKAEWRRVRRLKRAQEVAEQLESDDERELIAAGYTLTRSGSGRELSGMDDGSPFSVRVPLRCRTIREALDWLRPESVSENALRQGEWYFVLCQPEPEGFSSTEAGSERTVTHQSVQTFDRQRRHMPDECLLVETFGSTIFCGRKSLCSHAWRGRPRFFVRGRVVHPEHATIDLGRAWHQVIPNRAVGPFAVGSTSGGMD